MKKRLSQTVLLTLIVVLVAGMFLWWKNVSQPVSNSNVEKRVLITKGASGVQVGNTLFKEGLIKSPFAFKVYIQLRGYAARIQAGEYQIAQNLTLGQVVKLLLEGPSEIWVTVPEGLRREEVSAKFVEAFGLPVSEADLFQEEFLNASTSSEGYLFPDTYLVPKDITGEAVYRLMRNTFTSKLPEGFEQAAADLGYSVDQLVVLASILERETKTTKERPVVAGIYFNRLEIGMGLQADATVQYAVANANCSAQVECNWWKVPTRNDLTIDSPYNTYKYSGLPPAPIANPGETSLAAVVNPESSDYLYYIHDTSGNIYYAETLDEHNSNISKYLQ